MEEIQRVNNIIDASHIEVGQRLWIPRAGEAKDAPVPSVTIKTTQPTSEFKDNPNVNVQVVKQPTPNRLRPESQQRRFPLRGAAIDCHTHYSHSHSESSGETHTHAHRSEGEEATFPREVKEFGPERFHAPERKFHPLREYSPSGDDFNPG